MADEDTAAAELATIQGMMFRQFLSHLLWRLCKDVPSFDGERFLEQLRTAAGNMPAVDEDDPPEYQAQCALGLEEWDKLQDMAEQIIREARSGGSAR